MAKEKENPVNEQEQGASQETVETNPQKGFKDQFKEKSSDIEKPPMMSKEDTMAFYEENLPFMRLQEEYNELMYKHTERGVKNLELRVRELEAVGYLSEWKQGQDEARMRQQHEQKFQEEWDQMSDEKKEEWTRKAKENLKEMENQAQKAAKDAGNKPLSANNGPITE